MLPFTEFVSNAQPTWGLLRETEIMALLEPHNKVVMGRLHDVENPLSWRQWMTKMRGIPGMKEGACHAHYMAEKFGPESKTAVSRPEPVSEPPAARRVWTKSPGNPRAAVRASTNVRATVNTSINNLGDIVGEPVTEDLAPALSADAQGVEPIQAAGLSPEVSGS